MGLGILKSHTAVCTTDQAFFRLQSVTMFSTGQQGGSPQAYLSAAVTLTCPLTCLTYILT